MRDKTIERWQQRIQRAAVLLGSKLDEPPRRFLLITFTASGEP
jgi:hypothetical protein